MKENMLELARYATSEDVKFRATKDILDRAGLNPINKNQTESAKYVSIESRFSRDALERYSEEVKKKRPGNNPGLFLFSTREKPKHYTGYPKNVKMHSGWQNPPNRYICISQPTHG